MNRIEEIEAFIEVMNETEVVDLETQEVDLESFASELSSLTGEDWTEEAAQELNELAGG